MSLPADLRNGSEHVKVEFIRAAVRCTRLSLSERCEAEYSQLTSVHDTEKTHNSVPLDLFDFGLSPVKRFWQRICDQVTSESNEVC